MTRTTHGAARRATRTALLGTLTGGLLATTLAACSFGSGPSPDDAASELATGLEGGELPGLVRADGSTDPQEAYDAVVADLVDDAGLAPRVEVAEVGEPSEGGGPAVATATLVWEWAVGADVWSYETTADLTQDDETGAWTTTWDPALVEPSLSEDEAISVTRVAAPRARILGADGAVLVRDRRVVRVGIDKTRLGAGDAVANARRLAAVADLDAAAYARLVRDAGDQAFVEAIVLRASEAGPITSRISRIRGAAALEDTLPLAPTREFAAPILGRVGDVTAEIVEESDGRLRAGDVAGVSGLQARYDEQLAGTPGLVVTAGDEEVFSTDPEPGTPLVTTLDPRLQTRAERLLAVPEGTESPANALVAIRPSDGAILAAASGAGGDGLNVATYGQYAPGSTFKVVSALALLRAGLTPQSRVSCPATTSVDGKSFKNYDDYPADALGQITLRQAVANSCNTAFVGSADELGRGDLAGAAAALGLGVDQDLGFPAYFGQVPPPRSATEAAADLIGQGTVLASPMTMATVAASVQSGRTVTPYLLEDVRPEASPDAPLTGAEGRALRGLMRAVVTEGSGSVLAGLADGAKTGTAEYGDPLPDGSLATHAWMIAFSGDLAVAAFVETGESGSATAGPILRSFLSP